MIKEKRCFGNFKDIDSITPIQELDLIYIRKDVKLEKENNGNPLYSYNELILTPYQYSQFKDKYNIDDFFKHKEEILLIKEEKKEDNLDNNKIPLLYKKKYAKNLLLDDIIYGNTIQNNTTPSYDITSNIKNSDNLSFIQSGKNILKPINNLPLSIIGENILNQKVLLGNFGSLLGIYIDNKIISLTFQLEISGNTTENGSLILQTVGETFENFITIAKVENITQTLMSKTLKAKIDNFDTGLQIILNNIDGTIKIDNLQLEFNEPSVYEPYKEKQLTLNNIVGGLAGNLNVYDVYDYNLNKISRYWNTKIYNGSELENWNIEDGGLLSCFYIKIDDKQDSIINQNIYCNKLSLFDNLDLIKNNHEGMYISKDNNLYISINKQRLSIQDVSSFKQYLSLNTLTIMYQLKIPVLSDLIDVTGSFYPVYAGVNNISQNNNNIINKNAVLFDVEYYPPVTINIYRIILYPQDIKIELIGNRGIE